MIESNSEEQGEPNVQMSNTNVPPSPSMNSLRPSIAALSRFSVIETNKVVQTSASSKMGYTVNRSIKRASIPAGVARGVTGIFVEPTMQHNIDLSLTPFVTQIAGIVSTLQNLKDPSSILPTIKNLIEQSRGVATAFRVIPISDFEVVESGRKVLPAWGEDSSFQLEKDQMPKELNMGDFVDRWSQNQFMTIPDVVPIMGATGRALNDMIIAHILKRAFPTLNVWFLNPSSLNYQRLSPDFNTDPKLDWIEAQVPYDSETLDDMDTIFALVTQQATALLNTVPLSEVLTTQLAQLMYSQATVSRIKKQIQTIYGGNLYVYCGGLIQHAYLPFWPDAGTQLLLMDLADCFSKLTEFKSIQTEATSAHFGDPAAPEVSVADELADRLDFIAQLGSFLDVKVTTTPVAVFTTATSAADRYKIRMNNIYEHQTYSEANVKIGPHNVPLLIPNYGLDEVMSKANLIQAFANTRGEPLTFGDVSFEFADYTDAHGDRLDPADPHTIKYRTTESPNQLCIVEERYLSPYVMSLLKADELSAITRSFNRAARVNADLITGITYMGQGYLPYRFTGGAAWKVLHDSAPYQFDANFRQYLEILFSKTEDERRKETWLEKAIYLPVGNESTRRGGLLYEMLLTDCCIRITNPPDDVKVTGPVIVEWNQEMGELLSYQHIAPLVRSDAPYSAR